MAHTDECEKLDHGSERTSRTAGGQPRSRKQPANVDSPIWEQRNDETTRAYEGFSIYRSLGPQRSAAKVGRKLGKSRALIERWSARHEWVNRARVYDAAIGKEVAQDEKSATIRMNRRHIEESQRAQDLILKRLDKIRPEDLTPSDVIRWLDVATRIERRCMGLDEPAKTEGQVIIAQDGAKVEINQFEAALLGEIGAALRILPKEWRTKVFAEIRRRREMLEGASGEGSQAARADE
jgi:hypothetical protein